MNNLNIAKSSLPEERSANPIELFSYLRYLEAAGAFPVPADRSRSQSDVTAIFVKCMRGLDFKTPRFTVSIARLAIRGMSRAAACWDAVNFEVYADILLNIDGTRTDFTERDKQQMVQDSTSILERVKNGLIIYARCSGDFLGDSGEKYASWKETQIKILEGASILRDFIFELQHNDYQPLSSLKLPKLDHTPTPDRT
jgi:hypothetical protein